LGSARSLALHPSLAAAVSWRHAQLLTALPRREGEAAAWQRYARSLWEAAASARREQAAAAAGAASPPLEPAGLGHLDSCLGDVAAFTGQGSHGSGAVASLFLRRLLPAAGRAG
jgi:hypothetical protein